MELVGSNFMKVELANGFGPDNLWYWFGSKTVDGSGNPVLTNLSKANAKEWKDTNGNAYFGGTLSAGILSEAVRTANKNLNQQVVMGPFSSNGGSRRVTVGFAYQANGSSFGQCPNGFTQPSATLKLYRSSNGSNYSQVGNTINLSGSTSGFYEGEQNRCFTSENMSGGSTTTDSQLITGNVYYKAIVTNQQRYHSISSINTQELSILSVEE
jgi:hypothetical protein